MKRILGFEINNSGTVPAKSEPELHDTIVPVKSLVQVSFPDVHRIYSYYNDAFDLHEGDLVFVSGKLAGKCGFVESVNYKFKINLADYERIIAHPEVKLTGTYAPLLGMMISYDEAAVSPDTFRSWVKPPFAEEGKESEYVTGLGYSFDLEHFTEDDDIQPEILHRALDYCNEGRVKYLSVRNGVGTAFIEGTAWYEIDFRFEDGRVSEMFCECPYPGLCKHNLAVLITLRELLKKAEQEEFTALDRNCFLGMLSISRQAITLGG